MKPETRRRRNPARIADVARIAGVSVATVSRALASPALVSTKTRERVLMAVRETGYTPNAAARNLRVRETRLVLVVVPDIANPFFAEVLRGIDVTLSQHGYGLIIANLDNLPEREARYVNFAHAGQVDGVLLLCGHIPSGPERDLTSAGLPMVAACERIPSVTFPQVEIDNRAAAEAATAHLIGLGHRIIAYLSGPPANILSQERLAGYSHALSKAGIGFDPAMVLSGDFSFKAGAEAAQAVLAWPQERRPTAIFTANDEMAIGFLKTMHAAGFHIPNDFSVFGFDGIDYADYCEPTLTTVVQPRFEIGAKAAEVLVRILEGEASATIQSVTFSANLAIRGSTAKVREN